MKKLFLLSLILAATLSIDPAHSQDTPLPNAESSFLVNCADEHLIFKDSSNPNPFIYGGHTLSLLRQNGMLGQEIGRLYHVLPNQLPRPEDLKMVTFPDMKNSQFPAWWKSSSLDSYGKQIDYDKWTLYIDAHQVNLEDYQKITGCLSESIAPVRNYIKQTEFCKTTLGCQPNYLDVAVYGTYQYFSGQDLASPLLFTCPNHRYLSIGPGGEVRLTESEDTSHIGGWFGKDYLTITLDKEHRLPPKFDYWDNGIFTRTQFINAGLNPAILDELRDMRWFVIIDAENYRLIKNIDDIQDDLQKMFPQDYAKIVTIFQKSQHPFIHSQDDLVGQCLNHEGKNIFDYYKS